jgi:hypothetical protein
VTDGQMRLSNGAHVDIRSTNAAKPAANSTKSDEPS